MTRLLVVGLDCVPPELAFDRFADLMPNLQSLRRQGLSGPMRSTNPPITVPAWTSMVSGRDPGELGLYGFRSRGAGYDMHTVDSRDVQAKRVWDRASESGKRSTVLCVPQTWPVKPLRGSMVSCFLTPPSQPFTFPPSLAARLGEFGPYRSDVGDFRSGELERVFTELEAMRSQHFGMARKMWKEDVPDFLMMVEMGTDRLHHAAWDFFTPDSPRYPGANRFEELARRYYGNIDKSLGELLDSAGDAAILVVSDHGARTCTGAFAINDLLRSESWLTCKEEPSLGTRLQDCVDWSQTRAWGEGGYYSRIYLNVQGREPNGVIHPSRYEQSIEALTRLLRQASPAVQVFRPTEIYRSVRGNAPDLIVIFDDLATRAVGTLGHPHIQMQDLPAGVDGANHAWNGIWVSSGIGSQTGEATFSIFDAGRTMLGVLGVEADKDWQGRDWTQVAD